MTFWHQDVAAYARDEEAFLRGTGRYVDDIHLEGEAHGHVLRSPHAHALIRAVRTERAKAAPGVLAVLTAADIADIAPLGCVMPLVCRDGRARTEADRPVLAADKARHVGEPVAFIVAETEEAAIDAAALVEVDYDVLPVVAVPGPSPVPVWDNAPDNLCFDWLFGDESACAEQFAHAAHVARITLRNPRIAPAPIEPRGALGVHDPADGTYTLVTGSQGVHFVRRILSKAMGIAPEKLRVVTPHVGGGFGSKIFTYPEYALVLAAARATGRPVRWTCSRAEAFLSDIQARDHRTQAELALDAEGHFLAIRVHITVDMGACLSQYTPLTATGVGAPVQAGAYRFHAIEIAVKGAFTNTVPVDSYRGAGRPEATYVLERLIDRAADEIGMDRAELRARNLPEAQAESLTSVTGLTIDGGRFLDNQRRCLKAANRAGFEDRRAESAARGRLRGFGFANYLESNGGLAVARMIEPDKLPVEGATLVFGPDGSLDMTIGTQSTGQDHALPLARHAAANFALPIEKIKVRQGDTGALGRGGGTGGSKSLLTSSKALEQAILDVEARGRTLLAGVWKVPPETIHFATGIFTLADTNRSMSIAEIAITSPGALDGESRGILTHGSCANGCHACEVEIDPETGEVTILAYTAVDDFGAVLNPAAVLGQVQGGVAQGIGQALMELAAYDGASAQPLAGSFMDYAMPRAVEVPDVTWIDNGLVSRTNVFGAKACGEAGAAAAPPAVMNALADALCDYPTARSLQMPARAPDIWKVIHDRASDTA
ncbi:xanthine dehydrogenase family protein molybdopterin-binding subunit [Roseixanthobacter pseudopolyaromaticivorans]|uniref:xanthine dehydrogenase family protein molybdopterin-binding subunit n=1 Tax=Xanthobacteraceae TaxID=335928 RepID=UPI0037287486